MDPIDLGKDDGFVDVEVNGAKVRLDVFEAHNRIATLSQAHDGKPVQEFHAAVVSLMQEFGLPHVSHSTADRFVVRMRERAEQLQRFTDAAGAATPDSPGSTT